QPGLDLTSQLNGGQFRWFGPASVPLRLTVRRDRLVTVAAAVMVDLAGDRRPSPPQRSSESTETLRLAEADLDLDPVIQRQPHPRRWTPVLGAQHTTQRCEYQPDRSVGQVQLALDVPIRRSTTSEPDHLAPNLRREPSTPSLRHRNLPVELSDPS